MAGKRQSQNQLYEQYKGVLYGVCLRYSKTREEAEDILQEGFIKIFSDLYQYKPSGPLIAWMRKVVVNVALQHIRKNKRYQHLDKLSEAVNHYEPDVEVFKNNREEALLNMVQRLPDGFRIIFNLHVMEGYTHLEISKELGISVNTSKSQLSRAKAALRTMIEKNIITKR